MSSKIGWKFPKTNGGQEDGFNHSGITHFDGLPLPSLARETIQNSIDAPGQREGPVHVSFELVHLATDRLGGEELSAAIVACLQEEIDDGKMRESLHAAQKTLEQESVRCLRISDQNTTGLKGEKWRTLVKMQGASYKPDTEGAGGSHGTGKYAPFAVSDLRTVFYWTCYQENGRKKERFQGKSVLISHKSDRGRTQGTGFYGIKKECRELTDSAIPREFRVLDSDQESPVLGTSLSIAGFPAINDWRSRIAASVIGNFFYAVQQGKLTVLVEPDKDQDERNLLEINNNCIRKWFDYLERIAVGTDDAQEEARRSLREARAYWELSLEKPTADTQDKDLGHCKLWIQVKENLPSKVALVRRTGMLITDQQDGLIQFRNHQDFAALCVFEDPKGNELLRNMENPRHDKFLPERLPEKEKKKGRRALRNITKWIRKEIEKAAGTPAIGESTMIDELAELLPDLEPEDEFEYSSTDTESGKEAGFGQRVKVKLRPVIQSGSRGLTLEENPGDYDGDGNDTGNVGGGGEGTNSGNGGSGGSGEGDGVGGRGGRGGGAVTSKPIPVSNVRVLPIEGQENHYRLSFRASEDGLARLEIQEAGDSSTVPRGDIRTINDRDSLERVHLQKSSRTEIVITAEMPITDRALRLRALQVEGD